MAKLSYELNETDGTFNLFFEVNDINYQVGPHDSQSLWDVYNYTTAGYTSSSNKIIVENRISYITLHVKKLTLKITPNNWGSSYLKIYLSTNEFIHIINTLDELEQKMHPDI